MQNLPWIQVHQEHQGFQTHQRLPEIPMRQWHHAHRGLPVIQEEVKLEDRS